MYVKPAMRYEVGMSVWMIPIRYWEDREPEEWQVVEDNGGEWLLAKPRFDGPQYIQHDKVYVSKSTAIVVINLMTALKELRLSDDSAWLADLILFNKKETSQ